MHVWGKWKCLPEVSIISLGALVHLHSSGCLPQQTLSCQGVERKRPFFPPLHSWYLIDWSTPVSKDPSLEILVEGAVCGIGREHSQKGRMERGLASNLEQAVSSKISFSQPALPRVLYVFPQIHRELAQARGTPYPQNYST